MKECLVIIRNLLLTHIYCILHSRIYYLVIHNSSCFKQRKRLICIIWFAWLAKIFAMLYFPNFRSTSKLIAITFPLKLRHAQSKPNNDPNIRCEVVNRRRSFPNVLGRGIIRNNANKIIRLALVYNILCLGCYKQNTSTLRDTCLQLTLNSMKLNTETRLKKIWSSLLLYSIMLTSCLT